MNAVTIRHSPVEPLFQRFESKYDLSALQAEAVRVYCRPFVEPDPYAGPDGSYPVNSLYLDSPDLALHRSSRHGEKNRFKLRIRSYSTAPEEPVYFEVKRRIDRIIKKERAIVRRDCVAQLLSGAGGQADVLTREPSKDLGTLMRFTHHLRQLHAVPCCMVHYDRESWVSAFGEPLRITIDRNLTCHPSKGYEPALWQWHRRWDRVEALDHVLEIKFSGVLPGWAADLIRSLELDRVSFAKYVHAVDQMRSHGLTLARASWGRPA